MRETVSVLLLGWARTLEQHLSTRVFVLNEVPIEMLKKRKEAKFSVCMMRARLPLWCVVSSDLRASGSRGVVVDTILQEWAGRSGPREMTSV